MTLNIVNYDVHRILINNECLADILFSDAFVMMCLAQDWLKWLDSPLVGFYENAAPIEGVISLPVTVG